MAIATLRTKVVTALQFNHDTIDSSGKLAAATNNGATRQHVHNGTGAYYFDGTNNKISMAKINPSHITVSAWVKSTREIGSHQGIINQGEWGASYQLGITDENKFRLVAKGTGGGTANVISSSTVTLDEWYHVVGTYDGTTAKLYINGNLDVSSTATSGVLLSDTDSFHIGTHEGNTLWFQGYIDEPSIYNIAISQETITSLYNKGWGKSYSELTADEKTGLVSYWGFNGNAEDEHGANDGTVTGATLQHVKLGTGSYSFDGTNDYINLGSITSDNEKLTVSLWTKLQVNQNTFFISQESGTLAANRAFSLEWIQSSSTTGRFRWVVRTNNLYTIETTVIDMPTEWTHLVAYHDKANSIIKLYRDGNEIGSIDTDGNSMTNNTANIRIGQRAGGSGANLNGCIDNPIVFDEALTQTEITALYNSGTGRELFPQLMDGLVAYWKFDETTGDTASDSHISGLDGTASNARVIGSAGKINNGADFTKGNDYIQSTNSYTLSTNAFTFNFWVRKTDNTKPDGTNIYELISLVNQDSGSYLNIRFAANTGKNKINMYLQTSINNGLTKIIDYDLDTNWNMVTIVKNGSNYYGYINNNSKSITDGWSSGTLGANLASSKITMGARGMNTPDRYADYSLLDEPMIHNRALLPHEVVNLYNDDDGLQYPFEDIIIDEDTGNHVYIM